MAQVTDPSDVLPLPDNLKADFRTAMIAKFGPRMGDEQFDLLWQMIVSATWEYRQTAPFNQLDVQATLSKASDLSHQAFTVLGLDANDFDDIALTMIRLKSCAGFFGLYLDQFMLTSLSEL
jgi:hypothetical protein